jgi:plasmid maintenance system antidote protein VapI
MPHNETSDVGELSAEDIERLCVRVAAAIQASSVYRVAQLLGLSRNAVGSVVARRAALGTMMLVALRARRLDAPKAEA